MINTSIDKRGFNELTLQSVPPYSPSGKTLHDHCSLRQSAFEIHLTDPSNDYKQTKIKINKSIKEF